MTVVFRQDLLRMPTLPQLVKDLQQHLEDEKVKRQEFYEWIQEDVKAEFINGEIILHSPTADEHSDVVMRLSALNHIYAQLHGGGKVKTEKAMISLTRNDYEPDIAFWRKEKADKFTEGQTHFPAPDLIVEVLSKGTQKNDRTIKFDDYAAHSVEEYWIIDPRKKTIEQYFLPHELSNSYALLKKVGIDDEIESVVMQGFKIPVKAIFDTQANIEALKNLIAK